MLGKAPTQRALFSADNLYGEKLKAGSFYRFLADHRHEIFRDEEYASLYCLSNGRTSVPPSIVASACVLQAYDHTSDDETVERATYDVRWASALGTELMEQPFAKSTLQEFRAKLILHEDALKLFQRSLRYAQEQGYLKNRKMRIAMDTTHILGKGAVKDTYNLLADGIKQLYRALKRHGTVARVESFAERGRCYEGKSFKGEAQINWEDPKEQQALLRAEVQDAHRLLQLAQETLAENNDETTQQAIKGAASLLSALILQDVQEDAEGGARIKEGVAPDRVISTTDIEMRHGRKSAQSRFNGHKAAVATDAETELITAVEVIAGNAHDSVVAKRLVEASRSNTGNEIEVAIGDCAFGTVEVREQFEQSETELIAKVPRSTQGAKFTKHEFAIDLANNQVTCPAGVTTTRYREKTVRFGQRQEKRRAKEFLFPAEVCGVCELRSRCIRSKGEGGKRIQLHPREDLLQQARVGARTEEFREKYRQRVVAEHSNSRLVQRGIRKSRYFGRRKTLWQIAMAAAVVNLIRIAATLRKNKEIKESFILISIIWYRVCSAIESHRQRRQGGSLLWMDRLIPPGSGFRNLQNGGFRPGF